MKNDDREKHTSEMKLSEAARDTILDASEAELQDALKSTGLNLDGLAQRGRRVVRDGLARAPQTESRNELHALDEMRRTLGTFIQLLRRRDGLTEEDLATRARVNSDEIRRIEFDSSFTPAPRTLYQLEEYFKLPARSLAVLSGAIRARSKERLRDEAVKFAAHSMAIAKLGREEKRLLSEFVRFLAEQVD